MTFLPPAPPARRGPPLRLAFIVDPIDGTRSFVRGIPTWATLLGLEYQGELIAGVVEAWVTRHRRGNV